MGERFTVSEMVQRREVLHGHVWLATPVRVVADDDVLAVWIAEGTRFTFPAHPFGTHPWSYRERWTGTSALQLRRPGDAYAVWAFFHGARLERWWMSRWYRWLPEQTWTNPN